MYGGRNVRNQGIRSVAELLTTHGVETYFLIDRDSRTDDELHDLERQVAELGGTILTLGRREIENYFLGPDTVARFIEGKSGQSVDNQKVAEVLGEVLSNYRELALAKRVKEVMLSPVYPPRETDGGDLEAEVTRALDSMTQELQRRLEEVGTVIRQERERLDRITSPETHAPGAEVIDLVASRFGVRYNKSERDARLLAACLDRSEIHPDIRKLFDVVLARACKGVLPGS